MKLLGAEVKPVSAGHGTLKDAMNEALRDWVTNVEDTYYLIGTAAGPHPIRNWCATSSRLSVRGPSTDPGTGRPPAGRHHRRRRWGSNAIGMFHPFLDDRQVRIIGIEAGGRGLDGIEHCASMNAGRPGVLHGNRTYLLQNADGQILDGHSISAGLDYPGVGPEHSWLRDTGRGICADPRRRGACRLPALHQDGRHHSGPGIGPAIAHDQAPRRLCARRRSSSSISPAVATRMCIRSRI
jgi:tryptophan synthase beta chain